MSASRQGIIVHTGHFAYGLHQTQHAENSARGTRSVKYQWYDTSAIPSDYDVETGDIALAPVQQYQSLKRSMDGMSTESQAPSFITSLTGYSTPVYNKNEAELEKNRDEEICKSLVFVGIADKDVKYEQMVKNQGDRSGVPLIRRGIRTIRNRGPEPVLAGDWLIWAPPPRVNPPYYGMASKCRKAMLVPLRKVTMTDFEDLKAHLADSSKPASPLYEKNHTLESLMELVTKAFELGQANSSLKGEAASNAIKNALTTGLLKKPVTQVLNFPRREWNEKTNRLVGQAMTGGMTGHEYDLLQ
jgi:hypothetical protein